MSYNLLELMVKYNGSINRIERETGIKKEEIANGFDKLNLKSNARRLFIWKLAQFIEKSISENPYFNNMDASEIIAKEWNGSQEIKINKEVVQTYLQKSPLRLDNNKRAFQALCNGDIDSYKMFSQNDAVFFSQLLTRFGLHFVDRELDIYFLAEAVLPALFENIDEKNVMNTAMSNLGFKNRQKYLYDLMKLYTRKFTLEDDVFSSGLKSVIFSIIEKNHEKNELKTIYENIKTKFQPQENEETESDEFNVNEILSFEPDSTAGLAAVQQEALVEDKGDANMTGNVVEDKSPNMTEIDAEDKNAIKQVNDVEVSPFDGLLGKISNLSAVFQQNVAEAIVEYSQAANTNQQDSYILQLEEENRRLYAHIEKMEQEREVLQDRKLVEFLRLIGGNESRYLLSALYESSNGNKQENLEVSLGRVNNLFNFFQMFGIEPYTYGFPLGKEITVTKQELAQKYNLTGMLTSTENEITLRIVRHGWLLNGKVIVLPLVEEITHVNQ